MTHADFAPAPPRRIHLPRRRYNIFSGTNTPEEWSRILREFPSADNFEDMSLIGEYEAAFARAAGTAHAFGFAAGRMGLFAILEALGIGSGDEVILPAYTCVVVPNAVLYRGARPVYVDVDPRTFNIDVAKIEAAITPRTRALYAQHTFGLVCDVDAIKSIARKRGLPVIEDVAHALGAEHGGRRAGGLTEVGFFSTDHSKMISTLLGGMVTTSDEALAQKLRVIRDRAPFLPRPIVRRMMSTFLLEYPLFSPNALWIGWAAHAVLRRTPLIFFYSDELETKLPTQYPFPARLSSFQAKLGLIQLARLDRNLAHRREIGIALDERIGWMKDQLAPGAANHAMLRYSFLVNDRDRFIHLFERHFDLGIWFSSIAHGRSKDFGAVGYAEGSCPVAEDVCRWIVNFPTHERIDRDFLLSQVDRHLDTIRELVAGR